MTLDELQSKYPQFQYYKDDKNNRYLFSIRFNVPSLNSSSFFNEVDYSCSIEPNTTIDDKLNDKTFIDKLDKFFDKQYFSQKNIWNGKYFEKIENMLVGYWLWY